ncbi:unnamed protein product, partial [Auanema sp. JU1783]
YREKAENIAQNLTFTPGPVSSSFSVPSVDQVLHAFMSAKPATKSVNTAISQLLSDVKEMVTELTSLKKLKFNPQLAERDDAIFANLTGLPDIKNFERLTQHSDDNFGVPYPPNSSFTPPDQYSQQLLVQIFTPYVNNPTSEMSYSLKIPANMLIRPIEENTTSATKTTSTPKQHISTTARTPTTIWTTTRPVTIVSTTNSKPRTTSTPPATKQSSTASSTTKLHVPSTTFLPQFQQTLVVERRSIQDLDEQNLNAKANYIASKFDAEENFKNNIPRRIAQDHLQYATGVFQEDLRKHFQDTYENICEIQNKYLELWHSILHIEPTIAMRTILGREDIAARFVGRHIVHI